MMLHHITFFLLLACAHGFLVDVRPPSVSPPPPPPPYAYALDVGCGNGESTFKLQEKLPEAVVIGIDIDKSIIRQAVRRDGLFVHADAGQQVFPPGFFQYIQIQFSMIDIINKIEVIDQVYRVARKDSLLFLADYTNDHPVLEDHPLAPLHDPQENLQMMRCYFRQNGIICKDNILYSVFSKE